MRAVYRTLLHVPLFLVIVLLPGKLSAQQAARVDSVTGEQLYRSSEFKFRIKFPAGWRIADGDGAHVRKKATKEGATILVLVRDVVTPSAVLNIRRELGRAAEDLTDVELVDMWRDELDASRLSLEDYGMPHDQYSKFTDVEILAHRLDRIDNRPAVFTHAKMSYTAASRTVRSESISYQFYLRGVLYSIQAAAPSEHFAQLRPILERSVSTFVIEDW